MFLMALWIPCQNQGEIEITKSFDAVIAKLYWIIAYCQIVLHVALSDC